MTPKRKILASLGLLAALAFTAYLYRVPLAMAASPVELWFSGTAVTAANPLPVTASIGGSSSTALNDGTVTSQKAAVDALGNISTKNGLTITPVVSASAENNHVLKASAGSLYSVYATNLTATPGFLVVVNATSAPADGAITPLDFVPLPANGSASINYNPGPAAAYSTGITAILTSATTPFTKTTGVITGAIKGAVQ